MAIDPTLQIIERSSKSYPNLLAKRLGENAPGRLWAIGPLDLINIPKTTLFCSNRCPGDDGLKAMDQAQKWRDQGRGIISGFHSPIEKECLQILLRGRQSIIICPARSIETMRIPRDWKLPISGALLDVSVPVDLYLLKPAAFRHKAASGKGIAAVADRSGIKLL